jgi:6-phosphogluconolactonase
MRSFFLAVAVILVACGDGETTASTTTTTTTSSSGANGGSGGMGGSGGGVGGSGGSSDLDLHYLYVSNGDSDTISRFAIDKATGELTTLGDTPLTGGPGTIALHQLRLYIAARNDQSMAAFDIDPDGNLLPLGAQTVGLDPVYASVDATGSHLLISDYGADRVRVFAIGGDGTVGAQEDDEATDTNPHCIVASPTNQLAFVPNTNADKILVYDFDAGSGALAPAGTPEIATPAGEGPRHMVFHPTLDRFYVVNEHADSVSTYDYEPATGVATLAGSLSTLPPNTPGDTNTCADIHVTPDGKFVYASNRGHDSIAMFSADAAGDLTFIGTQPTEATPREFELAVDGKFLYAAGQASGMLAAYSVDPMDGTLAPIAVYPVGQGPLWVTWVRYPVLD